MHGQGHTDGVLRWSLLLSKESADGPYKPIGAFAMICHLSRLLSNCSLLNSDEYIFTPLGVKMSFLLTPERKKKLVQLTHRAEGGLLEKWSEQIGILEQDPELGG